MPSGVYKRTKENQKRRIASLRGRKFSIEGKERIRKARIGNKCAYKGGELACVERKLENMDNTDPKWYGYIHLWIRELLGKPETCSRCRRSGLRGSQIDWANISGNYEKKTSDWERLCRFCHRADDRRKKNDV